MTQSEREVRIQKIDRIRALGVQPYPGGFAKNHSIDELVVLGEKSKDTFRGIEEIVDGPRDDYQTAGRVMLHRSFGKLLFGKLKDQHGEIQFAASKQSCRVIDATGGVVEELSDGSETMSAFKFLEKLVDRGDFIGIQGELFYTHKGELTIFVTNFQLLSKAIMPLPEKFHGLEDQETRYRKRYLDMAMNNEVFDVLIFRSRFIQVLREFYWKHGFYELDTPVLGSSASGAAAKPFKTYHNDFDQEFYLRICSETELKKATVGGFEKNFVFGTNFRNEGSDPSHMQEFMMLEHQNVYKTFYEDMDFTEKMFDHIFTELELNRKVIVEGKEGNTKEVNFSTPWPRIDYVEGVNEASGLDIASYGIDDADKLRSDIRSKGIEFEGMDKMGTMTLIDYLYKKVLRPKIAGPAFIYNYPRILAPLARISDKDPNRCEKWQVVVNGWEIINSYGELVDPVAQLSSFDEQAKAEAGGDEEATSADNAFVQAMEYGMPCQAGFGMGIDRIVALLKGQKNLRDAVLFPLVRPEQVKKSAKQLEKEYRAKKIIMIADESKPYGVTANAMGQLGIAIGGHSDQKLFEAKTLTDKDGKIHYTDCFYGMANLAGTHEQMVEFIERCHRDNIQVFDFSDIMLAAHTDEQMRMGYQEKLTKDIGYIAVGALVDADWEREFISGLSLFGSGSED